MTKSPNKTPRKRDRQATMRKLFEAALLVFSERGFDGATTKRVAQEAGVTESLIMRYFGSKRGLLLALFEDFAGRRAEGEKLPYPESKDLEGELASFLKGQLERSLETKEFTRVIMGNASVDETMRLELNKKISLDWHPVLKARLAKYRERGEIPRGVPIDDIVFVLGFQTFATMYVGHMLLEMPAAEVRAQILRHCRVYAAGLSAQARTEAKKSGRTR